MLVVGSTILGIKVVNLMAPINNFNSVHDIPGLFWRSIVGLLRSHTLKVCILPGVLGEFIKVLLDKISVFMGENEKTPVDKILTFDIELPEKFRLLNAGKLLIGAEKFLRLAVLIKLFVALNAFNFTNDNNGSISDTLLLSILRFVNDGKFTRGVILLI